MLTWELVGAVVGAGMASGREIASFFSQYGRWSFVGIIAAVLVMIFLSDVQVPVGWLEHWPEKLWRLLLSMLLIGTGGAMLSGAGEVAALILPNHGAYWGGMTGTLMLAWLLAHRTVGGLAGVSRVLLCVLALLIGLGFSLPPMKAAALQTDIPLSALLRGMTYGGFNAALQTPILSLANSHSEGVRRRSILFSGVMILALLLLGNAVLLRHPALLGEPMPFIRMMGHYGKFGYYLGAGCLYLAILSTLTACLRGLGSSIWPVGMIILVSLLGFSGVVEVAYPLLGGGCFMMLLAAKFTNSSSGSFISLKDML